MLRKWCGKFLYRFSCSENAAENFCTIFLARKMLQKISVPFFLLKKCCGKFLYHFSCSENAAENFYTVFLARKMLQKISFAFSECIYLRDIVISYF